MEKLIVESGGFSAAAHFLIVRAEGTVSRKRESLLAGRLFDSSVINLRALTGAVKSIGCYWLDGLRHVLHADYSADMGYEARYSRIRRGYETCNVAFFASKDLSHCFLGETEEDFENGLYEYLMRTFTVPLKREWMPYFMKEFTRRGIIADEIRTVGGHGCSFTCGGRTYSLDRLHGYFLRERVINEPFLETVITEGVRNRSISVTPTGKLMQPMILTDLDTYRMNHGEAFVSNVKKLINPYCGLKGGVEEAFLCGDKKLYKQQGAVVNAAADNFFHRREPSLWFIEQMGCGKTIQAIAAIEETFTLRWLASHPGKTAEDAHAEEGNIRYRVIVMAPGHLVRKWAAEIEENIPYSKAVVIESLKDCDRILRNGPERKGKEFYVIGKDLCKLSCPEIPSPVKVTRKKPAACFCRRCGEQYSFETARKMIRQGKACRCYRDSGTVPVKPRSLYDFRIGPALNSSVQQGIVCPSCGQLMMGRYGECMMPWDFTNRTKANSRCPNCDGVLWKPLVSNINGGERKSPWRKVSFYSNAKKKDRDTAWVYSGFEELTYGMKGIITDDLRDAKEASVRKWAPARFIKEKLKDYFDFAVFDELHVYKGEGTAQGNAMHSLARASRQHIGLTGTIAGGFASDMFFNLWKLCPHIMKQYGYEFSGENGLDRFVAKYGTIETIFAANGDAGYNKMSRGVQISSPSVKPGISPDIFGDVLMPVCLFLDLTDMSNRLPDLRESVVAVDMDDDVALAYEEGLRVLKNASGNGGGLNTLSSEMLLYSLLYPDLPCGYKPEIKDAKTGKTVYVPQVISGENRLFNKERKLVELINDELDEGRNVFVYLEYTGKEFGLTERYRKIICDYCGLAGNEVAVLKSESPAAAKREEWIHKMAAKGVRVFISHPKCVETGLDFCFRHEGVKYNYPTLIFAECGVSLFTLWQASRRAYRLNQTEECRTYYLCYDQTNQAKIIRLMAEKQVATSSIQGKFSMEGLQAMAQSVDPRVILTQALMESAGKVNDDTEKASGIFSQLNEKTGIDESVYGPSVTRLFREVYGTGAGKGTDDVPSLFTETVDMAGETPVINEKVAETAVPATPADEEFAAFMSDFFEGFFISDEERRSLSDAAVKNRNRKRMDDGQLSLFDLFTA